MPLNREQFLSPIECRIVELDLPGKGTVRLRQLPESERIQKYDLWLYPNDKLDRKRQADSRLKIVALCVVGDDGQTFLTDADFPALRAWPAEMITRIVEVARTLCGLSDEDIDGKLKKTSTESEDQQPQAIADSSI